jgi:hypothetical protein
MKLNIKFECEQLVELGDIPEFDSNLHDPLALLMYVGEYLDNAEECAFEVSGFGDEKWPVDLETDFSVFFSQLPCALLSVKEQCPFTIDFYEQGVERTLEFENNGDFWLVRCCCQTEWIPTPDEIQLDSIYLEEMFQKLLENLLVCMVPLRTTESSWRQVIDDWVEGRWKP